MLQWHILDSFPYNSPWLVFLLPLSLSLVPSPSLPKWSLQNANRTVSIPSQLPHLSLLWTYPIAPGVKTQISDKMSWCSGLPPLTQASSLTELCPGWHWPHVLINPLLRQLLLSLGHAANLTFPRRPSLLIVVIPHIRSFLSPRDLSFPVLGTVAADGTLGGQGPGRCQYTVYLCHQQLKGTGWTLRTFVMNE